LDRPKLRPVEAVPVRQGGRIYVQIHDPARLSDKLLIVPQPMMFLLAHFDGAHTIVDIQAALLRQFGELVHSDRLREIVRQLDDALLLDSEHFRQHLAAVTEEFRARPVRLPASAGAAYPAEAAPLAEALDGYFTAAGGPGLPGRAGGDARLTGLVAPHIDFHRGGPCYAHAYKAVAEHCPAELFIVLGTAHFARGALYILTRKSFETPLGTMATDAALVDALAQRYRRQPFDEELVHKTEHSIEFQVVWLQHVLRGRRAILLPILCGAMDERVGDNASPRDVPEIADFVAALRDVVRESGLRACIVAGADLAHVGRQFGDEFDLTPQVMADVEQADRALLAHVEARDADAFYDALRADDNARHVCGGPPIYTLLAATDAASCRLLDYRQAADYEAQRAVTFASLALYA